jgi:hypothetical protein
MHVLNKNKKFQTYKYHVKVLIGTYKPSPTQNLALILPYILDEKNYISIKHHTKINKDLRLDYEFVVDSMGAMKLYFSRSLCGGWWSHLLHVYVDILGEICDDDDCHVQSIFKFFQFLLYIDEV